MNLVTPLVPRSSDGVLRVVIPGRITQQVQDAASIDSQHADAERWLERVYDGPKHISRLGEQASGWLANRDSMAVVQELIENQQCDLVLATELREIYRNPAFHWKFAQDCEDNDVRLIIINDGIDTADPNWEVMMYAASMGHGMTVPEARRRVRRKATHTFSRGGMVLKYRFGYRKLTQEEADSGQFGPKGLRIAKLPEWTPTIQEMRRRKLRRDTLPAIAAWLNEAGVPPGPYVTSGRWTAKLVKEFLRDPILSGRRRFRVNIHKLVYKTGKHRQVPNPDGPEVIEYPELAHFTIAEHDELLEALASQRNSGQKKGRDNPRWNTPRSRTLWPGQCALCGICGGVMHRMGGFLRCRNSITNANRSCWNRSQAPFEIIHDRILGWIVENLQQLPRFRDQMVEAAWHAAAEMRTRQSHKCDKIDSEIRRLKSEKANLTTAIRKGGKIDVLVDSLKSVDEELNRLLKSRAGALRAPVGTTFEDKDAVASSLAECAKLLVQSSTEFADLLRRLLIRFVITPVQALDCPQVRPRAEVTLSLAAWAKPGELIPEVVSATINLFNAPVHVRNLKAVVAARVANPRLGYREIGELLGLGYMTVKRTIGYARLMEKADLTDPYRPVKEAPAVASRWHPHKKRGDDRPAA